MINNEIKIYLAGAISSDVNYKEKFNKAQQELEELGFIVLSPTCIRNDLDYNDYFPICFAMMEIADYMVIIDFSAGVKREIIKWQSYTKANDLSGVYGLEEFKYNIAKGLYLSNKSNLYFRLDSM